VFQLGEERCRETFEIGRGQLDRVADLKLQHRLIRNPLDHVVAPQNSIVVHQRVGNHLDFVERIPVPAGHHSESMHFLIRSPSACQQTRWPRDSGNFSHRRRARAARRRTGPRPWSGWIVDETPVPPEYDLKTEPGAGGPFSSAIPMSGCHEPSRRCPISAPAVAREECRRGPRVVRKLVPCGWRPREPS